ncbi:hypothetical protein ACWT_4200 [Actinoplanes sp. SE50]|uniref:endo alpha-1,4 polygalactosaminidase n=1 Tax=unclassified Actinoplanes TaxID=2626549 RepID=UPI00023EC2C8|nr:MULTISPECIES: endo alpha-1,4 polygalactosaminidase [unclassified Actinoplanes]AEV85220.1 TBC1 domain family member 3B/I [Actinoplanes sp. SE50/110]ATO83615.1 hypothetical protein ACWT_4200 [Actinoplanes sp. SE50]SLM01023.1 hypothetical protein ACSP50_4256 [Actinoplanes sp. SE50/110]
MTLGRGKLAATAAAIAAIGVGIGIGIHGLGGRTITSSSPSPSSPSASPSPSATSSPITTATTSSTSPGTTTADTPAGAPPPGNASFDYQIGGAYTPPTGVTVVSRDSQASPAPGLYNICYVNAFQAQPGTQPWWQAHHPELLLRTADGDPVIDKDWNEALLDFSTDAKRSALTAIAGAWIDRCAAAGFQAVEPDNLDSYTRSAGLLTKNQAMVYATALAGRAHEEKLAIGQKNTAELSSADAHRIGFDFAVTEQCADFDECDAYTASYGDRVFVIEYSTAGFTKACHAYGARLSIVLRDLEVSTPDSPSYRYRAC